MATETKEPQGKILFKHTDIRTMKKDIKMLREFDIKKEQLKSLEPIVAPQKTVELTEIVEAEKQRLFALKVEAEKAEGKLRSLDAQQKVLAEKEKIETTTVPAKENEQRKKFMEDIEAWANSSNK